MSTVVASSAPANRSPAVQASSGRRVSHSWRPPPASTSVFPSSAAVKCRRPLPATCGALPEKHRPAFSIPPTALLYPVPPPDGKERWDIKEEESYVKLWFQVPGLSEDDLEIIAGEDMLEVKRKATAGDGGGTRPEDVHGVGSFHVRLLMTKEYDSSEVTAELKAGMLEVTVRKSTNRRARKIQLEPRGPAQDPKGEDPSKDRGGNKETPKPSPVVPPVTGPKKDEIVPVPKAGQDQPNQTQGDGATQTSTASNQTQGDGPAPTSTANTHRPGPKKDEIVPVPKAGQDQPNQTRGDGATQTSTASNQTQGDGPAPTSTANTHRPGLKKDEIVPVPKAGQDQPNQTRGDGATQTSTASNQTQGDGPAPTSTANTHRPGPKGAVTTDGEPSKKRD